MKQILCSLIICLLMTGKAASAQSTGGIDTILTTRGAVTLITSGSPISTFQIGDGKNPDYDYRIVDGNMVFVRPIAALPKPTNLIVREGENIHYMILAYREKAELGKLKYALSRKPKTTGTALAGNTTSKPEQSPDPQETPRRNGDREGISLSNLPAEEGSLIAVDTVTVGKIAADFGKDRRVNHQYEVKVDGISLGYAQAMTLNNMNYFCYRIRNKNDEPFEIIKATLLHKEKKDTVALHNMPMLYTNGPATIAPHSEASEVFVVPSKQFRKNDEVIMVLQTTAGKQQIVLYLPVTTLPRYMVSK
jgi:hypothetical protein